MTVTIYRGDARDVLSRLPENAFLACVTSPPYFGLRDYGSQGQLGVEESPDHYVANLASVFDLLKRVLHPKGTLWLNIGDTYAANRSYQVPDSKHVDVGNHMPMRVPRGMKPKDLMLIPAMLAIALRDRGWYLRSDIIWHRPNVMPERVKDRPTTAHEHVLLLSKAQHYHFAAPAAAETTASGEKRNIRSVWSINTAPLRGERHHAVFPVELVETCLRAGGSPYECSECSEPFEIIEEVKTETDKLGFERRRVVLDHRRRCQHESEPRRPVVIDPFFGSGTVGLAAHTLGMDCVGIEINPSYAEMAKRRLINANIDVQIREENG